MAVKELIRIYPCRRCIGGTVLLGWEGWECINCGAKHSQSDLIQTINLVGVNLRKQAHKHYKRS